MKKESDLIILIVVVFILLFASFVCASPDIYISNVLFKVSLKQGENITKSLSISGSGNFFLNVISVRGVSLSESIFTLSEGEKKNIDVYFDSSGIEPGVMAGSIEVTTDAETALIPIIFEVESRDLFFDANLDIPPSYVEVEQGFKLVAQVKIFDLSSSGGLQDGLGAEAVELEYNIFNLEGSVVSSENEKVIVDKQTQFTKTFSFPEKIALGDYIVSVNVKYKSSLGVSSQIFTIIEPIASKTSKSLLFSSLSDYTFLIIFGVIVFLFLGMIFLFFYFIRDRDRLMLKLKEYNSQELERQKEILFARKNISKREIKKEVGKIRKKHRERVKEFRKLKKKGKVNEMISKLKEWQRKGYNTTALEYKLKKLTKKEMRNTMDKWKKKYKKG